MTVNFLEDKQSSKHYDSLLQEAPDRSKLTRSSGDIGKKETGQSIVDAAVSKFGSLDIFVANAGVSQFHDFLT